MHTAFFGDRRMGKKQIHQHGLAAPDRAIKVKTFGGGPFFEPQFGAPSAFIVRAIIFQRLKQISETRHGGALSRIGFYLAVGNKVAIGRFNRGRHLTGHVCPPA